MREIVYEAPSLGKTFRIHVLEDVEEIRSVYEFLSSNPTVGFDTETTGLDIYASGHRLRTVQLGNREESYVIPYELDPKYEDLIWDLVQIPSTLIIQNAPFDTQEVSHSVGLPLHRIWDRVVDTKILGKLVDSRARKDGGPGHSLEELVAEYISPELATDVKGQVARTCKALKLTRAKYFAGVPIDDEDYLRYAGMDPILNILLYDKLGPLVPDESYPLIKFEHELAEETSKMSHRGWLVDRPETLRLKAEYEDLRIDADDVAWDWYCDNVNSPVQVLTAIGYAGIPLDGRTTPSGQPKVDGKFLEKRDHPLTKAIVTSKRATKWQSGYTDNFLANMDEHDRIHPVINTLAARTARMSVQDPAMQTCPPGVKVCLLADEHCVTCAIDYSGQELRVTAALSGDSRMINAFLNNEDLHQITADAAGVSREVGKMGNYLISYGGGWRALVEQGGVTEEVARRTIEGFKKAFPDADEFGKECGREAKRFGYVTTSSGRRLYVDSDRAYSAVNYRIQSDARDITCRAFLRLTPEERSWARMLVHDEIIFSLPVRLCNTYAERIAKKMEDQMGPVPITVEVKIGQRSWGSLYAAKE